MRSIYITCHFFALLLIISINKYCITKKINNNPRKDSSALILEVELKQIDRAICASHNDAHLSDEEVATSKISKDPKLSYRYVKKFNKSKPYIGPLLSHDNTLTNDPKDIYELLLNQYNSGFSVPLDRWSINQ